MRKFCGTDLLIATHNRGKFEEVSELLGAHGIGAFSAAELNLPAPEETGATFVENARIKAHAAAEASGLPALADDSGIAIDALEGAPGVKTADWAETESGRDFHLAMARAQSELDAINAPHPRTAQFCCTFVLAWPDGHEEIFEGKMAGQIVWPMRGKQGHGYDPVFQPDGYDVTFGEMDRKEKNRISHRADAFRKLLAILPDA